ncbi:MAG: DUF3822 family protein [Tannerella sp.]|jgi:hypothetical protein|nr:DUF3822 family protein [Tannerella sp.]
MIIRVPDTLNVNNSENYHTSIRLWPDGLSFSGYIPSEKESFFSETVALDRDTPLVQSLKEVFFNNECLSYVYHSLHVIAVSEKYTLVPDSVFSERNRDLLFSFCFQAGKNRRVLFQPLKPFGAVLLYDIDNEAYEFMIRSLINPRFIHFMSPMLLSWRKQSVASYPKRIYIVMQNAILNIACLEHGEVLFMNSFLYESENDIVYFIMYVCKQLSLNQLEDYMSFCGDKAICQRIMPVIGNYMMHVDFMPYRIDTYRVALDREMHADVVTLVECGL